MTISDLFPTASALCIPLNRRVIRIFTLRQRFFIFNRLLYWVAGLRLLQVFMPPKAASALFLHGSRRFHVLQALLICRKNNVTCLTLFNALWTLLCHLVAVVLPSQKPSTFDTTRSSPGKTSTGPVSESVIPRAALFTVIISCGYT